MFHFRKVSPRFEAQLFELCQEGPKWLQSLCPLLVSCHGKTSGLLQSASFTPMWKGVDGSLSITKFFGQWCQVWSLEYNNVTTTPPSLGYNNVHHGSRLATTKHWGLAALDCRLRWSDPHAARRGTRDSADIGARQRVPGEVCKVGRRHGTQCSRLRSPSQLWHVPHNTGL